MKMTRFKVGVGTEEIILYTSFRDDEDWTLFTKYYGIEIPENSEMFIISEYRVPCIWVDRNIDRNTIFLPFLEEFREYAKKLAKVNNYFADEENVYTFYKRLVEKAKSSLLNNLIPWEFHVYNFDNQDFERLLSY